MKEDIIWSKDEHFLTLHTDVTSQELPSLSDPKASPRLKDGQENFLLSKPRTPSPGKGSQPVQGLPH